MGRLSNDARRTTSRGSDQTDKHAKLKPWIQEERPQSSQSRLSLGRFIPSSEEAEQQPNNLEAPTVPQLVVICLDYLRHVRRSHSASRDDLEIECGINQDYLTVAIWALSKSFVKPTELSHGDLKNVQEGLDSPLRYGNDPFVQPEYVHAANFDGGHQIDNQSKISVNISDDIKIPMLKVMESDILYKKNPNPDLANDDDSTSDSSIIKNKESACDSLIPGRITWYEYEDEHYSNQHRFYSTQGLSSKNPLTLPEIAMYGLRTLNANTRQAAETNMKMDPLFENFVEAVTNNGFFDISERDILSRVDGKVGMNDEEIMTVKDQIYEEKYKKVLNKFRTKLAAKFEVGPLEEVQENHDEKKDSQKIRRAQPAFRAISEEQTEDEENTFHDDKKNEKDDVEDEDEEYHIDDQDDDATLTAASVFGDVATVGERQKSLKFSTLDFKTKNSKASKEEAEIRGMIPTPFVTDFDSNDLDEAEKLKALGNVSMKKKKYDKARQYYTKALEIVPVGPTSHIYFSNRAAALLSMRNFNEAVWDAERSLALKPDYPKAYARLGLAHFLLGRYKDAVDAYSMAIKYDPNNKTSVSYLEKSQEKLEAIRKEEEEVAEAEKYIENAKKLMAEETSYDNEVKTRSEPSSGSKESSRRLSERVSVASKSSRKGQERKMKDKFKETRRTSSRQSSGHAHRSTSSRPIYSRNHRSNADPSEERSTSPSKSLRTRLDEIKNGSPEKHRPIEEEAMLKDPPAKTNDDPSNISTQFSDDQEEADRLKGEGNKAMARKQYEKAVKYYSKALRLAPAGYSSHVYFSNRAAALCYLERYEEAELDAERSLALNPDYGKAHARLGLSRYFLRDYDGAVEAYESALHYDPSNAASKNYLAKAKLKLGRRSSSGAVYAE